MSDAFELRDGDGHTIAHLSSEHPGTGPSCEASTQALIRNPPPLAAGVRTEVACRTCGAPVILELRRDGQVVVNHAARQSGLALFS